MYLHGTDQRRVVHPLQTGKSYKTLCSPMFVFFFSSSQSLLAVILILNLSLSLNSSDTIEDEVPIACCLIDSSLFGCCC